MKQSIDHSVDSLDEAKSLASEIARLYGVRVNLRPIRNEQGPPHTEPGDMSIFRCERDSYGGFSCYEAERAELPAMHDEPYWNLSWVVPAYVAKELRCRAARLDCSSPNEIPLAVITGITRQELEGMHREHEPDEETLNINWQFEVEGIADLFKEGDHQDRQAMIEQIESERQDLKDQLLDEAELHARSEDDGWFFED